MVVRRFTVEGGQRKIPFAASEVESRLPELLDQMQRDLYEAALRRREENSHRGVSDYEKFKEIMGSTAGFIYTGYCGAQECEARVKDDTKATIRVIPDEDFRSESYPDTCICGRPAQQEAVWARAY
jgi:prolyl-tRNA synthetase